MANGIAIATHYLNETLYLTEAVRISDAALISAKIGQAKQMRVWLPDKFHTQKVSLRGIQQAGVNALPVQKAAKTAIKTLCEHGMTHGS